LISCGGMIRKQAVLFETNIGKGRLFVSSAVYRDGDPACTALMDGIFAYVQSADFKPKRLSRLVRSGI